LSQIERQRTLNSIQTYQTCKHFLIIQLVFFLFLYFLLIVDKWTIDWSIDWLIFIWTLNWTQQRSIEKFIEQCEISKNPTLTLEVEWNWKEREIPNSISTLTHLHIFKLIGGYVLNMDVNAITSLHNQIQTCIIKGVQLTPNLNDKSNPIYTLTKLCHLELIGCEIRELNETISKLTSLQTLLLSDNYELNRLLSSMTKLCHLELIRYGIDELNKTISNLTSLQTLLLSNNFELK
jgi:hypothetical protein